MSVPRVGTVIAMLVFATGATACGQDRQTEPTSAEHDAQQAAEYVVYRGTDIVEFDAEAPARVIERVAGTVCGSRTFAITYAAATYTEGTRLFATCGPRTTGR